MITWKILGEECACRQGFNFRNGQHRETYTSTVHIELSNGVRRSGRGYAWSWGPSQEAADAAERRAYGNLYHEVIPQLREQYGKLRRE